MNRPALVRAIATTELYDPAQARDERGRFSHASRKQITAAIVTAGTIGGIFAGSRVGQVAAAKLAAHVTDETLRSTLGSAMKIGSRKAGAVAGSALGAAVAAAILADPAKRKEVIRRSGRKLKRAIASAVKRGIKTSADAFAGAHGL